MKKIIFFVTICLIFFISCNPEVNENLQSNSTNELIGIRVKQPPTHMMYLVNEELDLSGLIINGVYSNGTEKEIKGYTINPVNGTVLNEAGSVYINISYKNYSCNFSIVVYEEGQSFEDVYSKGYIGRTINLLTAKSFVPDTRFTPIFDFDKLYKIKPEPRHIGAQNIETVSGESIEDLSLKIKAALNIKIFKGADMSVIGIPAMINFGLTTNIEDQFESSYKTEEYYCHSKYLLEEEVIGLEGYSNIRAFTQYLTKEFLDDASSVGSGLMSPKTFIEKYGTNVLMASTIGASFNATYHISTTNSIIKNEFNSKFQSKFESSLFDIAGESSELGLDLSILCNQDTKETASYFKAEAQGGGVFSFSTGEGARNGFTQWANSVNTNNLTIISVPDESLYFVWDLLDDSYAEAKKVLYDYFIKECENLNNDFLSAAKKYQPKDSFVFDETNNTVTCDLGYFYDNPTGEGFNYSFFTDGVLTIMPKYNQKPVSKVIIKGQYGTENSNGIILDDVISGLSIKISDGFNTDKVEIILENVGIIGKKGIPTIDLTGCSGIEEVEIRLSGKNFLSSEEDTPVIKSDCLQTRITSDDNKITGELPVLTRKGCLFEGWYTELEGGKYISNTTMLHDFGSVTLYARWKEDNTYIMKRKSVAHDSYFDSKTEERNKEIQAHHNNWELGKLEVIGASESSTIAGIRDKNGFVINYKLEQDLDNIPNPRNVAIDEHKIANDSWNLGFKEYDCKTKIGTIGKGTYVVRVEYEDGEEEYYKTNFLDGMKSGQTQQIFSSSQINKSRLLKRIHVMVVYETFHSFHYGFLLWGWAEDYANWMCTYDFDF